MPAVVAITVVAFACGALLALAAKWLHTPGDARMEHLLTLLPGLNCGACGHAGCGAFAKALAENAAKPGACPANNAEKQNEIAVFLGVAPEAGAPRRVALVMCGGSDTAAKRRFAYNGVADCAAAAAVAGGDKACARGCLGYATCANTCPVQAIAMRGGLAVVDPARCVGCGLCVAACPRKIIRMVPARPDAHVLCASPEKGSAVRTFCKRGCLGCRLCVKHAPGAFAMVEKYLASRDDAQPPPKNAALVAAKCAGKCIQSTGGGGC
ncbi:MAG: 4Fe-4S binding protein [Kiritimatiellaeota bacterium]|nr:4Fe-4S binding protein [Kiritimatiellota bacterium]